MEENFLLCGIKSLKTKNGDTIFYLVVYSDLTETVEKIYITVSDYEYINKMGKTLDISKHLKRYYNQFKKTFAIKFTRDL